MPRTALEPLDSSWQSRLEFVVLDASIISSRSRAWRSSRSRDEAMLLCARSSKMSCFLASKRSSSISASRRNSRAAPQSFMLRREKRSTVTQPLMEPSNFSCLLTAVAHRVAASSSSLSARATAAVARFTSFSAFSIFSSSAFSRWLCVSFVSRARLRQPEGAGCARTIGNSISARSCSVSSASAFSESSRRCGSSVLSLDALRCTALFFDATSAFKATAALRALRPTAYACSRGRSRTPNTSPSSQPSATTRSKLPKDLLSTSPWVS
eukprot:scaffold1957_cov106-Phaeocystis_antarctica.AAC.2